MIRYCVANGPIISARVGNLVINISHLFYADDAMIIFEWNKESLVKIDVEKSHMYGVGVQNKFLTFSGCPLGEFPFSYLELPIGINMNRIGSWKPLVDRFKKRLAELVVNELEGVRASLFWGSADNNQEMHWVSLEQTTASFDKGGLNVRSWRLCKNPDALCGGCVDWNWSREFLASRTASQFNDMLSDLGNVVLTVSMDSWMWSIAIDGVFQVGCTRQFIDSQFFHGGLVGTSWVKSLPRKVNIFIWRVTLDRLPTRLNFAARGMEINDIGCLWCTYRVESLSHTLNSCEVALDGEK
ncbi:uncharacterized protein [Rutidosis leptorrhynchoides]|uniref:uncharacterized protein n=1 Tax=Rutidosis leptorrhynchoides TaxID=125765 RepID=UPI003A99309D